MIGMFENVLSLDSIIDGIGRKNKNADAVCARVFLCENNVGQSPKQMPMSRAVRMVSDSKPTIFMRLVASYKGM